MIDLDLFSFPVSYMDDFVRHRCQRQIVRDHDDRHISLTAGLLQERQDLFAGDIVQCACWFVA